MLRRPCVHHTWYRWHAEYDFPLGVPLSEARHTVTHLLAAGSLQGVLHEYEREYASGTKVRLSVQQTVVNGTNVTTLPLYCVCWGNGHVTGLHPACTTSC